MKKEEVLALHGQKLHQVRTHRTFKGETNDGKDHNKLALDATRSELYEALYAANPPPGPHPDDDGDPELTHARQKAHNKKLWKQVEALVAAAGLSEKGAS